MANFISPRLTGFFLQVLNMSFTASFVIVFVLLARLFLRKAPSIFSYALWGAVLFRLFCPISFASPVSLIPMNAVSFFLPASSEADPKIHSALPVNPINPVPPGPIASESVNPPPVWTQLGAIVWVMGIAILAVCCAGSLLRLRTRLIGAVPLQGSIYLADHIPSPFVAGLLRPKIYLPSGLSVREQTHAILHEQAHIKRFDHFAKPLAFAALCMHWFNPLVWAAFVLASKDMEMSCDESVMKSTSADIRTEYAASLLSLATGRHIIAGTPLAFGGSCTGDRIRNVMRYKRPAKWVLAASVVTVSFLFIALLSNPMKPVMDTDSMLTVEALKTIAKKGTQITWEDFQAYEGIDIGSGLYIMRYQMDNGYYVLVGGIPDALPMYVRLCSGSSEQYIDIREESIDDFISRTAQ